MSPTLAISIRTLDAFRQFHRVCPRFSIQAQCKSLCHLHHVSQLYVIGSLLLNVSQVPYSSYLCTQFSIAFDIYLEVIHCVEERIRTILKRDSQEWRLQNECPACFYRLDSEPPLTLDWLISIDGNNSLKRWDTTVYGTIPREDSRGPRSTYWLSAEDVDKFKDEVKARKVGQFVLFSLVYDAAGLQTASNVDADVDVHHDDWDTESDDDNELSTTFNCIDRWRNARSDVRKKSFSVFKESGIFVATCRHRFVLLACDMIKSGEL